MSKCTTLNPLSRSHHQTLPHRRAVLILLLVAQQRRRLIAELVHQNLKLENGAFLRAVILVLNITLQKKGVGVDGPVHGVHLLVRGHIESGQ